MPAYMSRETLARALDTKPGQIDQLVQRGVLPPSRDIGGMKRWSWDEVDATIKGGKTGEVMDDDPYITGARRAAETPSPRQARPQQGRQAVSLPDAAPGTEVANGYGARFGRGMGLIARMEIHEAAHESGVEPAPKPHRRGVGRSAGQGHRAQARSRHARRLGGLAGDRQQPDAMSVEHDDLERATRLAGGHSSIGRQSPVPRVAVTVHIDYERQQVAVLRTGKLIWSASIAGKPGASPLLMPVADFVQLVANMLIRLDPTTHAGGAGSRASISASSDRLNGSASVLLSGGEIDANAGDAEKFTTGVAACMKFTTSGAGRSFQISEPIWRTWCSCVTRAIGSCIPDEIRAASSYDVSIELTHGYTAIPYRGKPAADGPRYKALGNSMAVNVMRWIGRRIEQTERERNVTLETPLETASLPEALSVGAGEGNRTLDTQLGK